MSYPEKRSGKLTGKYYGEIDQRHKGGERFRRLFDSKKLADAYEGYVKAAGQEPPGMSGEISGRTFASVAAELKDAGGPEGVWAAGRDDSVIPRLAYVCDRPEGKLPIEKFGYGAAEALVAHLKDKPGISKGTKMSPATINRYLTATSAVLTYAERQGYIERTPELPWRKVQKKKLHTYTKDQSKAVIAYMAGQGWHDEAFVMQVYERTGLRASELLELKASQIDDEFILLDDPEAIKNGTTRTVWIGEPFARQLRVLITTGKMPIYWRLYRKVVKTNKALGYEIKRPLHTMRRTAATRIANAPGMALHHAQRQLGHRSIRTTEGYVDVDRELLREQARRLHGEDAVTAVPEVVPFARRA